MSERTGPSASDLPELVMLRQLIGASLVNPTGERLGRVEDLIVKLDERGYPPVTGLKVRIGSRDLFVGNDILERLVPGEARLRRQTLNLGRFERRAGEVLLRQDVLDHHLVDVVGGRIIRANDLALARIDGNLRLVGVDRKVRGVVGRLLPAPGRRRPEPIAILDWKDVQPFVGHVPTAKLLMPLQRLKRLHPAQIADLVERASHVEGEEIIHAVEMDAELTADVFEELDTKHQLEFVQSRTDEEAAALLARMAPDDAADLLQELDQKRRLPVLNLLPPKQQHRLRALLEYHPTSAGGMMSPEFVAVSRGTSVEQALARVRAEDKVPHQLLTMVFVTEPDGRLIGSVPTVDLIRMAGATALETSEKLVTVGVGVAADLDEVTLTMADYNLTALAVVDGDGRLIGALSVDDLLEQILPREWRRRFEASSGS